MNPGDDRAPRGARPAADIVVGEIGDRRSNSVTMTVVVRSCGHEIDMTGRENKLPSVGEQISCWSACDKVPTFRGANNPNLRHVVRIETRPDGSPVL